MDFFIQRCRIIASEKFVLLLQNATECDTEIIIHPDNTNPNLVRRTLVVVVLRMTLTGSD